MHAALRLCGVSLHSQSTGVSRSTIVLSNSGGQRYSHTHPCAHIQYTAFCWNRISDYTKININDNKVDACINTNTYHARNIHASSSRVYARACVFFSLLYTVKWTAGDIYLTQFHVVVVKHSKMHTQSRAIKNVYYFGARFGFFKNASLKKRFISVIFFTNSITHLKLLLLFPQTIYYCLFHDTLRITNTHSIWNGDE